MASERVFCARCGRAVELVHGDEPSAEGQATIPDVELACLQVDEQCGEGRCAVLALPAAAMRQRLARLGLAGNRFPRMRAHCGGCDRDTEMILVGLAYSWCTECGTTNPTSLWDEMELPTQYLDS